MNKTLLIGLIACLMIYHATSDPYCSSTCVDYTGACFDDTPTGCWACATSIYHLNIVNQTGIDPCVILPQTTILADELSNTAMSLFGYTSSNPTPHTCTNYTFSGQYTANDYLSKNFSGIPLNHYALVIRYNVGYLGNWSQTDYLRLNLQDNKQSIDYDHHYYCDVIENLCNESYNSTDCIRIREFTMVHNTSYVFLNFSALTNETDPNIQFWGIKQLKVVAKMCHAYCLTCYGASNANCLTCAEGYYLQGNVCVPECDSSMYHVSSHRLCMVSCPTSYFSSIDTNGSKVCLACQSGCMVCSGASICQAWEGQEAYRPDPFKDKMEFWILLIIVIIAIISFVIYKLVKRCMKPKSELEEKLTDDRGSDKKEKSDSGSGEKDDIQKHHEFKSEAKLLPTETMITDQIQPVMDSNIWFNQLVELQPTEVKVTKSRRRRRSPPMQPSMNDPTNSDL